MRNPFTVSFIANVVVLALLPAVSKPLIGQTSASLVRRTLDGKPDLNGIWQVLNTANWDVLSHGAQAGQIPALGAVNAVAPGIGVVEGDEIPYVPEASAKRVQNLQHRWTDDPELKCYLPGVPRATYMPYPFQILQTSQSILIAYEYADAVRTINMGKPQESAVDSWMGWSNGHWEGDTLVVDVTGFNDQTWFDRAGDFHSEALHVIERYTPINADVMNYEVSIEDPKVFSRPWKMRMPIYRHLEENAQLMEFKCVEFAEELLYGHLRRQPAK
jgi:hypothetical protein